MRMGEATAALAAGYTIDASKLPEILRRSPPDVGRGTGTNSTPERTVSLG